MDNNTMTPNEPMIPAPEPTTPQPGPQPVTGQPIASAPNIPALPAEKKPMRTSVIETIILIVVCVIAAAAIIAAVVFYLQWNESQTNINGKIDAAVATAVKEEREIMEAAFAEREKLPNLEFVGPSDYGSLSFMYPRTWSVFVAKDASKGGDFEAYFNPVQINPLGESTIHALRLFIVDRPIDQVSTQYDALVRNGSLTYRVYTVGDISGSLYEGAFNQDITGIALMIKINDKTAILRTDAEIFRKDFEALIATIRKN